MKKLVVAISMMVSVLATADETLSRGNFINLMRDESGVRFRMNYPGLRDSNCGVRLRSSRDFSDGEGLQRLAKQIVVTEGFHESHANVLTPVFTDRDIITNFEDFTETATFAFPKESLGTYVTVVRIETKSGESLKKVIRRAVPIKHGTEPATVIVESVDCSSL